MGAEVILLMEKGEISKLRNFFKNNFKRSPEGLYWLRAPQVINERVIYCYVEFKGGARVNVGYQMSNLCSEWATAVACEIRSKFKIKKGGWDSIGYSKDFFDTRAFQFHIEDMEEHIKRHPKDGSIFRQEIEYYRKYQEAYEKAVAKKFIL